MGAHVEVGDGLPGVDCAGDHLHELVRRDTVTHARVQRGREGGDEGCMIRNSSACERRMEERHNAPPSRREMMYAHHGSVVWPLNTTIKPVTSVLVSSTHITQGSKSLTSKEGQRE